MYFKLAILFSSLIGCILDAVTSPNEAYSYSSTGSNIENEKLVQAQNPNGGIAEEFSAKISGCSFQELLVGQRQAIVTIQGPNAVLNTITGSVVFTQTQCGGPVTITGNVSGSTLIPGLHGWHIHEQGDLTDGCTSTLAHFNPFNERHGAPTSFIRHLGDLGNILVGPDNVAKISQVDYRISLFGINSIIGRGLVIHALPDDFVTQPTGNSAGRIGCGVIGHRV